MWWVPCESRSQAGLASLNSKFKTSNVDQKTKSTNELFDWCHFKPFLRFWFLEPVGIAFRDNPSYITKTYFMMISLESNLSTAEKR